jgi:hypothetical protein
MARIVRISVLLIILLAVAQGAWKARARTTDWQETLRVAVYPINGDGSAAAGAYVSALRRPALEPVAVFLREQARLHGLALRDPVDLYLAPAVVARPPAPPIGGSPFDIGLWSLRLRWWAWRHDGFDGPRPHVRVFVQYHAAGPGRALAHSVGLRAGMIVIANAFADAEQEGSNNVVIAHELLHTFGATDKYDPADNLPQFPDGYADPRAIPLFPQSRAEIMGGRIPRSRNEADIPHSLDETVIGPATAREISWAKPAPR